MKQRLDSILFLFLAALVGAAPVLGEQTQPPSASAEITAKVLESQIAEVKDASDIEEGAKTKLLELYQEALSNLEAAKKNKDAAEAFRQALQTAPQRIQKLRDELSTSGTAVAQVPFDLDSSAPADKIEQILQKEKADLAAVSAKRGDIERELDQERAKRPDQIQQRLDEAKKDLEEVARQLSLSSADVAGSALAQANLWLLETRQQWLDTEIEMLERELQSQPARIDLLKAEQDQEAAAEKRMGERVDALEALINRRRQQEAHQTKADAEETKRQAEAGGKDSLVVELAERNAALSNEISAMASRLDEQAEQREQAQKLATQIDNDFESAHEAIEIGGLSEELGQMLLQQRHSLPDLRALLHATQKRERLAAEVGVQRLRYRQEQKQLRDPSSWVADLLSKAATLETPALSKQLLELAAERRTLLEKAIDLCDLRLRRLGELETAQQRLTSAIETYDTFLNENLLWMRSASRAELEELGALPEQIWRIISPRGWLEVLRVLIYQSTHSPVFVLLVVALGALLWSRRHLIAMIQDTAVNLGKPTTDNFRYSLQAFGFTLAAAAAWPLVAAVVGWQLIVSGEATDFTSAVGRSLFTVAAQLFYLRALFLMCLPGGLAAAHFRWRESVLGPLRNEVNRLSWIYLPTLLVAIIALHLDPLNLGWLVGRSAFVIVIASVAFAFYRLLNPKSGTLADYLRHPDRRTFRRLHRIWYPLLVAAVLSLGLLSLLGYVYTAFILMKLLVQTAWMIVGLIVIAALARRWLVVTRRHLAYEAAMERRQKALEAKGAGEQTQTPDEAGGIEAEEPEADLVTLTDTSNKLIDTAVAVAGLIGFWMIWSEVIPALRILNEITLWDHTVTIDGKDQVRPFTLASLGLTLSYAAATVILVKQLPSVLEIILLKRVDISPGSRYTVTTLATYVVIAIGILLVLNTVGAQWSKLQWLVAALGVGIGFGLQEIVANFISGIIILLERPIRVGDIVSVGGTDGVVTKIRIRATAIRNWDRQELLVPNKELVTGQVLNWSLSDKMTRIVVSVGVAYGTDVDKALDLMREAAEEQEHVLVDPAPLLSFEGFGDNSLSLFLRAYLGSLDHKLATITALHKAINRKLAEAGIEIAFPQRDLHLDTADALRVRLEGGRENGQRITS